MYTDTPNTSLALNLNLQPLLLDASPTELRFKLFFLEMKVNYFQQGSLRFFSHVESKVKNRNLL